MDNDSKLQIYDRIINEHFLICTLDKDAKFIYVNTLFCKACGYSASELLGEEYKILNNDLDFKKALKRTWHGMIAHRAKSGDLYSVDLTVVANFDNSVHTGYSIIATDVSTVETLKKELIDSKKRFNDLFENSPDPCWLIDEENLFALCNKAAADTLGYDNIAQLIATHPSKISPEIQPDGRSSYDKANEMISLAHEKGSHRFEWEHVRKNGDHFSVEITLAKLQLDGKDYLYGIWRDVSMRKDLEKKLLYQASHDYLTELINRREFEARLKAFVKRAKTETLKGAVIFIDLDRFKPVNDLGSHAAGDEVLKNISKIIQNRVALHDSVARIGGDEFCVLLEDCTKEQVVEVSNLIREDVDNAVFFFEEFYFKVGLSAGIRLIDGSEQDVAAIMSSAGSSCQIAKNKGRNQVYVCCSDGEDNYKKQKQEINWLAKITHALASDKFVLFAQEIKSLNNQENSNKYYEILLRLTETDGEILSPGVFIPSAERYGIMFDIDCWVLREAFAKTHDNLSYSINLSGHSIANPRLLDYILDLQKQYNVDSSKINFEITETATIQNLSECLQLIDELKQRGFKFALDDFGSGLSSFSYLKDLEVDLLKIDGSFVEKIEFDQTSYAILKSINDIGHTLGLATVAEFVDSEHKLQKLQDLNINYVQGFHIHKPEPLDSIINSLNK